MAPDLVPVDAGALAVMAGVLIVVVGAWIGLRRAAVAADPDLAAPSAPGAAVVLSLAMSAGVVVLWLVNPFSALVMVPALHLWMLATLVDPAPGKRTRLAMVAGGLVLPVLLVIYQLLVLGLNPLAGAWYLLLLVTGGHISVVSSLLGCLFVGHTRRRDRRRPQHAPRGSAAAARGAEGARSRGLRRARLAGRNRLGPATLMDRRSRPSVERPKLAVAQPPSPGDRALMVRELSESIADGSYTVDPGLVAEAMLDPDAR